MRRHWAAALLICSGLALWWTLGQSAAFPTAAALPPSPASSGVKVHANEPIVRRAVPAMMRPSEGALAMWRGQLERAQNTLDAYRQSTRYPFTARPISEQPDQAYPRLPIVEDLPLRMPGSGATPGLMLRTTQERVHIQADETVRVTLQAHDGQGQVLPLRIVQSWLHEGGAGQRPSHPALVPVSFRDDGQGPDMVAGDGVYSALVHPAGQGFADLAGTLRLEVTVQAEVSGSGRQGHAYFDVVTSPGLPATWAGPVKERLQQGSLWLDLPIQVRQAGRYVASGRIDDANGRPVALLSFNEALTVGPQRIRLQLFGKLVHDLRPQFPLRLRDVEAFRLIPDAYPDRAMMARDGSPTHTTAQYGLSTFSEAEWTSDERDRYLAEYGKDVTQAEEQIRRLTDRGP